MDVPSVGGRGAGGEGRPLQVMVSDVHHSLHNVNPPALLYIPPPPTPLTPPHRQTCASRSQETLKQQGNRWSGSMYNLNVCVCVYVFIQGGMRQPHTHTCLVSDMENRPSHAQLTSNTLYTSQTIHLPAIAISVALNAALSRSSYWGRKKKKAESLQP